MGLNRQVTLINKEKQGDLFFGLIIPEVKAQLKEPDVFLVGAVEDETPLGVAVLRLHKDAGEILSIATAPGRRREKIGTALLWESVRILKRLGCDGMYSYLMEQDQEAAALFQAFGMKPDKNSEVSYSCTLFQLQNKLLKSGHIHSIPLESVPKYLFNAYTHTMLSGDPRFCAQNLFDPQLSRVIVENGKMTACILIERIPDGLSIGWFHSFGKDRKAPLYLLQDALQAAEKLSPDTYIRFMTNLPNVLKLAEKYLPAGGEWTETRWAVEYEYFRLLDPMTRIWEG